MKRWIKSSSRALSKLSEYDPDDLGGLYAIHAYDRDSQEDILLGFFMDVNEKSAKERARNMRDDIAEVVGTDNFHWYIEPLDKSYNMYSSQAKSGLVYTSLARLLDSLN